jgi:hypothetical protein
MARMDVDQVLILGKGSFPAAPAALLRGDVGDGSGGRGGGSNSEAELSLFGRGIYLQPRMRL